MRTYAATFILIQVKVCIAQVAENCYKSLSVISHSNLCLITLVYEFGPYRLDSSKRVLTRDW